MTPAGFPHSDIHGSKPACGSPWLFAAYHVFLRRPVPWHPPCALSNLIVTNLSSCQRIAFAIFDSFFLLRPTAKLFAFLRAYSVSRVSQLVSLQDVFHLAVQFSMYIQASSSFRFPIPENDTSSRRTDIQSDHSALSLRGFLGSSPLQSFDCQQTYLLALVCLYRPGMNFRISPSVLSLERR